MMLLEIHTAEKESVWGWGDGLVVKSNECSSRGAEFNSQQLQGGSQPSVQGWDCNASCIPKALLLSGLYSVHYLVVSLWHGLSGV